MNASELLTRAHGSVHAVMDALPDSLWEVTGVCGGWSCHEMMAHLAAHEHVLVELLASFTDAGPTPTMQRMRLNRDLFNDEEVTARADHTPAQIMAEYDAAHARAMSLIADIAPDVLAKRGTLPWFGEVYALDDFLVYDVYGHKNTHMAQVECFRNCRQSEEG